MTTTKKLPLVAFLHTTKSVVSRFDQLANEHNGELVVKHHVFEPLLQTAQSTGKPDFTAFGKAVEKIQKDNPSLIICTCSTYGDASDQAENVVRIDRPVVQHMITNFQRIGLAYTVASTFKASETLVRQSAEAQKKEITLVPIDCSAQWAHYCDGKTKVYHEGIGKTISQYKEQVDVVFLAQASMEGTGEYLDGFGKPVLSSPEHGVAAYLGMFK